MNDFKILSIKGAIAALEAHSNVVRIEDGGGDNEIAMYHLLHSLLDVAEKEGFSFDELLDQVKADHDI